MNAEQSIEYYIIEKETDRRNKYLTHDGWTANIYEALFIPKKEIDNFLTQFRNRYQKYPDMGLHPIPFTKNLYQTALSQIENRKNELTNSYIENIKSLEKKKQQFFDTYNDDIDSLYERKSLFKQYNPDKQEEKDDFEIN